MTIAEMFVERDGETVTLTLEGRVMSDWGLTGLPEFMVEELKAKDDKGSSVELKETEYEAAIEELIARRLEMDRDGEEA